MIIETATSPDDGGCCMLLCWASDKKMNLNPNIHILPFYYIIKSFLEREVMFTQGTGREMSSGVLHIRMSPENKSHILHYVSAPLNS